MQERAARSTTFEDPNATVRCEWRESALVENSELNAKRVMSKKRWKVKPKQC